ncbi:MAG TPA: DUF5590 domain-containing protein [Planococcus sp. (in: firmicutes)]|nr:DUF5590 domain-containing protein [Planococcus sp. (in: firmicutes)]
MKQWIIFFVSFLSVLAVSLMIIILIIGNKPYTEAEKQAIERVMNEEVLAEVDHAYVFAGSQLSVTVIGSDAEGKLMAVFVPDGEGEIGSLDLEGITSSAEARETAFEEMDVKDVLHTKLGMESEGPVWEIAFINEDDRLNYVYIFAEDGTWWKRILNL